MKYGVKTRSVRISCILIPLISVKVVTDKENGSFVSVSILGSLMKREYRRSLKCRVKFFYKNEYHGGVNV